MTIFIDTNGEMDFADNERLRFVMHFLKLGSDPDVLEIRNNRFVREDAETSFQEIWLPCATAKQKEIDDLKADLVKAKAQAVPEGYKLVPVELSENIAERLAFERVPKPRPENDPVWVEIAERAYKSNLLAKKWELVREYKILTEASESGAEG
ncbi:hypothetical protein V8P95_05020 [Acinetobacter baumannii]